MLKHAILPLVSAMGLATAAVAAQVDVPITEPVGDRTHEAWAARWWSWALSFPRDQSPIADTTGEKCAAGQQGPVWFLAGSFGDERVQRTCTVPRDKYLFFPVLAWLTSYAAGTVPCANIVSQAKQKMEPVLDRMTVIVDDDMVQGLLRRRIATESCFELKVNGAASTAATDGYWVMLKPLPPGKHRVIFRGKTMEMSKDIMYTITVE